MDILPTDHAEFSSRQYWERFFRLRGQESFEWYGNFDEIYPSLRTVLSPTSEVLIVGCGNSNFSSDLYDHGVQSIVNLDFSELVIQEMMIKNIKRTNMRWDVGDMTNMSSYNDNSFDLVIDKGALDALMSSPGPDTVAKAKLMFSEIQRVLRVGGAYVCISLVEDYILDTLVSYFISRSGVFENDWAVEIHRISSAKPSPFISFMLVLRKLTATASPLRPKLFVDSLGNALASHLELDGDAVASTIQHIQRFQELRFKLSTLEVGRLETISLWSDQHTSIPRFSLFVLDVGKEASLACAVFFIPTGRESDFQFTTAEGLADIAFQAHCRRLIAVACNRPHSFPEMHELQAELSPFILALAPADRDPAQQIPFLAVGGDPAWETVAEGESPLSGRYVIEEREDEDDATGRAVFRRLVFLQNQLLVQSEVRLVSAPSSASSSSGSSGKKDKKKDAKKKAKKSTTAVAGDVAERRLDIWHVDSLYRAMLACLCLRPGSPSSSLPQRSLVVGLGGGALVMAMQRFVPGLAIDAVELDGSVVELATQHFGFAPIGTTTVHVTDGLQFIATKAEELTAASASARQYDVVVIDVDSKDLSSGLSAPPRAFLSSSILHSVWNTLLAPSGILLLNVVARSKERLQEVFDRLDRDCVGGTVFRVRPAEDAVNLVVAVVKPASGDAVVVSSPPPKKGKAPSPARAAWYESLRGWIQAVPVMQQDRLQLESYIDKIEDVRR